MRVVIVSHSAMLAGAERSLLALAESLGRYDADEVVVVLPRRGPLIGKLQQLDPTPQVVVSPMHLWAGRRHSHLVGLIRLVQCVMELPRLCVRLWRLDPDVIVVNSSVVPTPMVAAKLLRVPLVVIVRETLLTNSSLNSFLPRRAICCIIRFLADELIAVSQFVAEQVGGNATVVYEDVDRYRAPSIVGMLRGGQRASGGARVLSAAIFGSISAEKGQLDAVEAVALAREWGANVTLDVIGDGSSDELRKVGRAAADKPFVRVLPAVSNIYEALPRYDVTLMCSKNEAFGRVTVESLSAGVPVVGYACGATMELLSGGGGLLVAVDATALGQTLAMLASNEKMLQELTLKADRAPILTLMNSGVRRIAERVAVCANER